ncbi:MAG: hypothetical protein AB7U30_09740, partial [Sulfuricellaceae bacterium]
PRLFPASPGRRPDPGPGPLPGSREPTDGDGGHYRIGLQFVDFVSDETAALRAIAQYTAAAG